MKVRRTRGIVAVGPLLGLLAFAGCGPGAGSEQVPGAGSERTSFAFAGVVEGVDPSSRTLTVRNDDIPGWMGPMSMTYTVDRPETLGQLTAGARIRATVYSGDFSTLYGIEVVP